ncbi:NAAT family transporter [Rhodobacteraceae bacterium 2CG4]|uniref:UPF0056 membrane protein n=1 Tax=Halovulum marinum TaxID=2662447 RepID=A0A6L5Z010_9RHOB|nr:MarC family protein [Halovulum marinum]MSU89871.1 NAAT family transporter [Halovulum marinum]
MIDVALTAFVTMFVIIDPIGLSPLFAALSQGMDRAARRRAAGRAALIGFGVLAVFGVAGERLLDVIGIGFPAFRISGGILLFLISVEMLFDRRTERRSKAVDTAEAEHDGPDPSVFPMAVPLLAGPGALATIILLMGQNRGDYATQAAILGTTGLVVLLTYVGMRASSLLEHLLGQVGINVITRLLGMLLAALSVQFVIDGLRDVGALTPLPG